MPLPSITILPGVSDSPEPIPEPWSDAVQVKVDELDVDVIIREVLEATLIAGSLRVILFIALVLEKINIFLPKVYELLLPKSIKPEVEVPFPNIKLSIVRVRGEVLLEATTILP